MVERTSYRGWENAYRISNATVEIVVLADVGPRVVGYRFIDGENLFTKLKNRPD